MIVELPSELRRYYACYATRSVWHIGRSWMNSDPDRHGGWKTKFVCRLDEQQVRGTRVEQGPRSRWCLQCRRWLADRIMRQDWS